MKSLIIYIIVGVLSSLSTLYVSGKLSKDQITETVLTINKADSLSIVQKSREGWIKLEDVPYKQQTVYKDSIILRDSVVYNIVDSSVIVFVPYFYSDTTFYFEKKTKKYNYSSYFDVRSSFFPKSNTFKTSAILRDINININVRRPKSNNLWYFASGVLIGGTTIYFLRKF